MRPLTTTAAALAGALLLSGCAGVSGGLPAYSGTVSEAKLAGTWTGDCHAGLVLRADHTLTTTDFPTGADTSGTGIGSRFSGTGTWAVLRAVSQDTPATVHITVGSTQTHLDLASGHSGSLVLSVTLGDPDNGVGCLFNHAQGS